MLLCYYYYWSVPNIKFANFFKSYLFNIKKKKIIIIISDNFYCFKEKYTIEKW